VIFGFTRLIGCPYLKATAFTDLFQNAQHSHNFQWNETLSGKNLRAQKPPRTPLRKWGGSKEHIVLKGLTTGKIEKIEIRGGKRVRPCRGSKRGGVGVSSGHGDFVVARKAQCQRKQGGGLWPAGEMFMKKSGFHWTGSRNNAKGNLVTESGRTEKYGTK